MTTYVFDKALGVMVDRDTRAPMVDPDAPLAAPMVLRDTQGYASPIDGKWVEGRRARRYDLEKNNCVDANDLGGLGGKLKNERFAQKHGLERLLK